MVDIGRQHGVAGTGIPRDFVWRRTALTRTRAHVVRYVVSAPAIAGGSRANVSEEPRNLEQLLDRFCRAQTGGGGEVTIESIVHEVGDRSFGPLLLFAGVIMASPLSGIPGMPTSMGVVVMLVTAQLLLRRNHFWLPRWLLQRSVRRSNLERAVKLLRVPARAIDRLLRPRLATLVSGRSVYVIGVACLVIALGVPTMEVVPFSATAAGVALSSFGLSLIARDGLLALVAFAVTFGTFGFVVYSIL